MKTEQAVTNLKKVMAEGTDFKNMLSEARQMSKEFSVNTLDVLQAMENTGRVLKDSARTIEVTKAAIKNAISGNMDLGNSANYLMSALNQFQLASSSAEDIGDVWNHLANNYATTNEELAIGFSTSGAAAKQAGVNYLQLAAALTALNSAGISASEGANALSVFFNRMKSDKAVGVLKKIGVEVKNATGEYKSAMEVLAEVAEKFKTLGDTDQQNVLVALAGQHQYKRLVPLIQNFELYKKAEADLLANRSNSMNNEVATQLDQTKKALEGLKNEFLTTINIVGEEFVAEPFRRSIEQVRDFLRYLNMNEDSLSNILDTVTEIGKQLAILALTKKSTTFLGDIRQAGTAAMQQDIGRRYAQQDTIVFDLESRRNELERNISLAPPEVDTTQLRQSLNNVNIELERERAILAQARNELNTYGTENMVAATRVEDFATRQAHLNREIQALPARSVTPALTAFNTSIARTPRQLNLFSSGLMLASRGIRTLGFAVKGFMAAVPEMLIMIILWEAAFKAIDLIWQNMAKRSKEITEQIEKDTKKRIEAGTQETNAAVNDAKNLQENLQLVAKLKEDLATKKAAGIDVSSDEAEVKKLEAATQKQADSMINAREQAARLARELENLKIKKNELAKAGQSTQELDKEIAQREKLLSQNKLNEKDLSSLASLQERKKALKDKLSDPKYANAAMKEIIEINNKTAAIREQIDAYIALNAAKGQAYSEELSSLKKERKSQNDNLFSLIQQRDKAGKQGVLFKIGNISIGNPAAIANGQFKVAELNKQIQQAKKERRDTDIKIKTAEQNIANNKQVAEILAGIKRSEVNTNQTILTDSGGKGVKSNSGQRKAPAPEYTNYTFRPQAWQKEATITSNLGYRIHPIFKTRKYHDGVDFSTPNMAQKYYTAPVNGKVMFAGGRGGYGNQVAILADDGITKIVMSHLANKSLKVKAGDLVKAGQPLAKFGATGYATGVHGHLQIYKDNQLMTDNNFYRNFLKNGMTVREKTSNIEGLKNQAAYGNERFNVPEALAALRDMKEYALNHNEKGEIVPFKNADEVLSIQKDYVRTLAEYKSLLRQSGATEKEINDVQKDYIEALKEKYKLESEGLTKKTEGLLKESSMPLSETDKEVNFNTAIEKRIAKLQEAFILLDNIDDDVLRNYTLEQNKDSFNGAYNNIYSNISDKVSAELQAIQNNFTLDSQEKADKINETLQQYKSYLDELPVFNVLQQEQINTLKSGLDNINNSIQEANLFQLEKDKADLEVSKIILELQKIQNILNLTNHLSGDQKEKLNEIANQGYNLVDKLVNEGKISAAYGNDLRNKIYDKQSDIRRQDIVKDALGSESIFNFKSTNSAAKEVNSKYDNLISGAKNENETLKLEQERQQALADIAEKGNERALAIQQAFVNSFVKTIQSGNKDIKKSIEETFKSSLQSTLAASSSAMAADMSKSLGESMGPAGAIIGSVGGSVLASGFNVLLDKLFGGGGDGYVDRLDFGTDSWSYNSKDYASTDNVYAPPVTQESVKIVNFNNTFNIESSAMQQMSIDRREIEKICEQVITRINRINAKASGVI